MTETILESELEVNKRLQVGRDELVYHEHDEGADHNHQRQRHLGEPNAITTLEVFRQPVNNQAYQNEDEHILIVDDNGRDLAPIPVAAHLVDHVLGCVPRRFIGFGRVKVGAAAEEQTGEGDEGEGLEDSPSIL